MYKGLIVKSNLRRKEERGITLIALVITIIVLLILAGISIAMLSGQNGILNRSQEAKLASTISAFNEQTRLAYLSTKTSITSKISSSGYIVTSGDNNAQNLVELATDVANGLGVTAVAGGTDDVEIDMEGYTVAYYLDVKGSTSKDGEGYIVIWYTNNGFRSSIKDRSELFEKYSLIDTEGTNTSRNQAVLVAVMQVKNYTCNLSETTGLTSTTDETRDIGINKFSGTTLNGDFGFTSTALSGINFGNKTEETIEVGEDFTIGTESFRVLSNSATQIVAVPHYNITLVTPENNNGAYPEQTSSAGTIKFINSGDDKYWITGQDDIDWTDDRCLLKLYIEAYSQKLNAETGNTGRILARLGKRSEFVSKTSRMIEPGGKGGFWLGSSNPRHNLLIYLVDRGGSLSVNGNYASSTYYGIRPVVVIDL